MNETLNPLNSYENLFRLGVNAFNEERYNDAINYLEKAYQYNSSYDIHRLLVICHIEIKDYQIAKIILKERFHDYMDTQEGRMLYAKILIYTHEFITARIFIYNFQKTDTHLDELLKDLQRDEEYLYAYHHKEYEQFEKQLLTIEHKSYVDQIQLLKEARFLPYKKYEATIIPLLVKKDFNIILRASLLNDLHQLNCDSTIEYRMFNDKIVSVIPKQLQEIINSRTFVQLEAQIEIELASQPDIRQSLLKELPLIFSVLYPYPEQFILNPKRFLNAMLYRYGIIDKKEESSDFKNDINILNQINKAQCQIYGI